MALADPSAEGYSAVFFMDGIDVSRQMRATEFDAFLDGYVGLSDLADTEVRAVFVQIGTDLLVRGLVFFRIYFDEQGRADSHWNIPVETLAGKGSAGPDMGAGPIRLVCRSLCPEKRYKSDLWDPDMTPGSNHFQTIRKAVTANHLKFRRKDSSEDQIPVLRTALGKPDAEVAAQEATAQRNRLAHMIREQRLRIKTLQSAHKDSMSAIQREHRLEYRAWQEEKAELERSMERARLDSSKARKRLERRDLQVKELRKQLEAARASVQEAPQGLEEAAQAEVVLLREQLERKQREVDNLGKVIRDLELSLDETRDRAPDEDSLIGHLKDQKVFLVGYHAGVGHITLPFNDLRRYFDNPTGYAAEKCGISEPAYRRWLEHYENPVCRAPGKKKGQTCGRPVMRVSQPADFEPGVHDRCDQHASAE
ncbi:DNA repair protein [Marinobacter lacisalsi]|uniref:DNA repair protein n=1 Tax=Marinobacter lacisalsi TaxID=475979 RepID=A0ABV8QL93_9GAMM